MFTDLASDFNQNPDFDDDEGYSQISTVKCPFDESHILQQKNLLTHLYRCKSPNRHLYVQCRYDPCHWIYPESKKSHQQVCPTRIAYYRYFDFSEGDWEQQQTQIKWKKMQQLKIARQKDKKRKDKIIKIADYLQLKKKLQKKIIQSKSNHYNPTPLNYNESNALTTYSEICQKLKIVFQKKQQQSISQSYQYQAQPMSKQKMPNNEFRFDRLSYQISGPSSTMPSNFDCSKDFVFRGCQDFTPQSLPMKPNIFQLNSKFQFNYSSSSTDLNDYYFQPYASQEISSIRNKLEIDKNYQLEIAKSTDGVLKNKQRQDFCYENKVKPSYSTNHQKFYNQIKFNDQDQRKTQEKIPEKMSQSKPLIEKYKKNKVGNLRNKEKKQKKQKNQQQADSVIVWSNNSNFKSKKAALDQSKNLTDTHEKKQTQNRNPTEKSSQLISQRKQKQQDLFNKSKTQWEPFLNDSISSYDFKPFMSANTSIKTQYSKIEESRQMDMKQLLEILDSESW